MKNLGLPRKRADGYYHVTIRDRGGEPPGFTVADRTQELCLGLQDIWVKGHRHGASIEYNCISSHGDGPGHESKDGYHLHIMYRHYGGCKTTAFLRGFAKEKDGDGLGFRFKSVRCRDRDAVRKYILEDRQKHVLVDNQRGPQTAGLVHARHEAEQDPAGSGLQSDFISCEACISEIDSSSDGDSSSEEDTFGRPQRRKEKARGPGLSPFERAWKWAEEFCAPDFNTFRTAILRSEEALNYRKFGLSQAMQRQIREQLICERNLRMDNNWLFNMEKQSPLVRKAMCGNPMSIKDSLDVFHLIMSFNKINKKTFVQDVYDIMSKTKAKFNCMVALGESNAGKTLLINSIGATVLAVFKKKISGDANSLRFEFQNCIGAECLVAAEFTITEENLEVWLPLMGGERSSTDVKNGEHEALPRFPMFMTTNKRLGQDLNPVTKGTSLAAIENRCRVYNFKTCPDLAYYNDKGECCNPEMWPLLVKEYVKIDYAVESDSD